MKKATRARRVARSPKPSKAPRTSKPLTPGEVQTVRAILRWARKRGVDLGASGHVEGERAKHHLGRRGRDGRVHRDYGGGLLTAPQVAGGAAIEPPIAGIGRGGPLGALHVGSVVPPPALMSQARGGGAPPPPAPTPQDNPMADTLQLVGGLNAMKKLFGNPSGGST